MGKIRQVSMGDEATEKRQKKKAEARRDAKKAKKQKVEGLHLEGGQRVAVIEGTEIKPEFKRLVEEVEKGETVEGKSKKAKIKVAKPKSKRYQEAAKLVDRTKLYALSDAVNLLKKTSTTKFDGTVEIHLNLNPQNLDGKTEFRGSAKLPHGTGKEVKVAIADDTVLANLEAGTIDFDVLVAHPSMMPKLAKFARVLGPKGLMPNPKNGTVSQTPEERAKELSSGQVNFKTEPIAPIIHMPIGKVSYDDKKIEENVEALVSAVGKNKIMKATITSSMGPGIKLDLLSF